MTTPSSAPIRVLVVDDHTMVRRGLATFLKVFDNLNLAGEAASGQEAIQLCASLQPDVVLMDMVMPDMDGATATRLIRKQWPQIQVLALTSFKEEILVQSALQAGAIGYLLKDVSADELAQAIRAAHAGRSTLSPEAAQALAPLSHGAITSALSAVGFENLTGPLARGDAHAVSRHLGALPPDIAAVYRAATLLALARLQAQTLLGPDQYPTMLSALTGPGLCASVSQVGLG